MARILGPLTCSRDNAKCLINIISLKGNARGTWMVQLVKDLTFDFGSGCDLRLPAGHGICLGFSPHSYLTMLSLTLSPTHFLSKLKKKNYHFPKKAMQNRYFISIL